jgi:hypothetical protein
MVPAGRDVLHNTQTRALDIFPSCRLARATRLRRRIGEPKARLASSASTFGERPSNGGFRGMACENTSGKRASTSLAVSRYKKEGC